jgi:hypothetical protein
MVSSSMEMTNLLEDKFLKYSTLIIKKMISYLFTRILFGTEWRTEVYQMGFRAVIQKGKLPQETIVKSVIDFHTWDLLKLIFFIILMKKI